MSKNRVRAPTHWFPLSIFTPRSWMRRDWRSRIICRVFSIVPVLEGKPSQRKHLYSAFVAHTTGIHQYWPTRTVTDGRWKLTHHVFGDGKRERYPEGNKAVFSLNRQLSELPTDSLAVKLANRCEVPPAFELYDLQNDPHEFVNLIGDPQRVEIEERLRAQLQVGNDKPSIRLLTRTS